MNVMICPRCQRQNPTGAKFSNACGALEPALPAVLALVEVPVEDPQWQALDPPLPQ
ncbi:MAG TPA: hypothetical protein VLK82_16360 [Candidatus Tectomicrobia bacterium]|nr:hypothetical protein [Candidatus Tectomicrobia bacterium]